MADIVVVGAGFAGFWAAAAAARARQDGPVTADSLEITLIAPRAELVIRPRLYEAQPGDMRVPVDALLSGIDVRFQAGHVTGIDTERRTVTVERHEGQTIDTPYDRLVLASGSRLTRPSRPWGRHVLDVDTLDAAVRLDAHLAALAEREPAPGRLTAVVVGSGFTGLEVATELVTRLADLPSEDGGEGPRVVLVERASTVAPELGEGPRPAITVALDRLGVEVRTNVTVASVDEAGVALTDGTTIPAATVVWTAGMRASELTEQLPGERDHLGRLQVDPYLRVSAAEAVFAAGDTAAAFAQPGVPVTQSCQHATPLGKTAGWNAAADLLGLPFEPFQPDAYITCLDLGAAGAVITAGWDRVVVRTGEAGKKIKQNVNTNWIYPPATASEVLAAATPQAVPPTGMIASLAG